MYLSISTLFVVLTTLLTQSLSAQLTPTKSSTAKLYAAKPTSNSTLSLRGDDLFGGGGSLAAIRRNAGNSFDFNTNPNGFVNLGTAESVCSSSTIYHWLWLRVKPVCWPLFQYLSVNDVAGFVNQNVIPHLSTNIVFVFDLRQEWRAGKLIKWTVNTSTKGFYIRRGLRWFSSFSKHHRQVSQSAV